MPCGLSLSLLSSKQKREKKLLKTGSPAPTHYSKRVCFSYSRAIGKGLAVHFTAHNRPTNTYCTVKGRLLEKACTCTHTHTHTKELSVHRAGCAKYSSNSARNREKETPQNQHERGRGQEKRETCPVRLRKASWKRWPSSEGFKDGSGLRAEGRA